MYTNISKTYVYLDLCAFIYVFITLIHHFVLFFSIFSQKEKLYVKRKNNTQSSCMIFFLHFISDGNIF